MEIEEYNESHDTTTELEQTFISGHDTNRRQELINYFPQQNIL